MSINRMSLLCVTSPEKEQKIISHREETIKELVSTERRYVYNLGIVVEKYIERIRDPYSEIPIPETWNTTSESDAFGNLEAIYSWHKNTFLNALETTLTYPKELGPIFEKYERKMLSLYTKYIHNYNKSTNQTLNKFEEYFEMLSEKSGEQQQIAELLFKPIQRVTVYHLLIEKVCKYTMKVRWLQETDSDSIQRALTVVKNIPHNINAMMKFRDVLGYTNSDEGNGNGKLLYHGCLFCAESGENDNTYNRTVYYKGEKFMVYLFEKNILFSVVVGMNTKNNEPKCYYRNHIPVNNMSYRQVPGSNDTFTIRSVLHELELGNKEDPQTISGERPKGVRAAYTCRAESPESCAEWIQALRKVIAQQYDFAGALENPTAYQNMRN